MKNDKESYLSKLNFEDKSYILSLYESINKNPLDNLLSTIKPFWNILSTIKLKLKAEEHPSNGLPKEEVLSTVKLFLIFSELSLFQSKYEHNPEIDQNFLIESSLLINDIYKLLSLKDNNYSLNEKEGKTELDIILDFIFIKYIDGIHSYFDFVNLVENQTKKNNKENTGNSNTLLSYEQFQKYFKIVIKFFLFSKGFERVYYCLNKNDKLNTNEIVFCYNKIIKNLNESNLFYIVAKKIVDMIDTSQTHIDKNKYYSICIRALS
jgi:hypothetical protein